MRSPTSCGTSGLPGIPLLLFHRQYQRKPRRCQAITVSGFTISNAERHPDQRRDSPTQKSRSAEFKRSRPRCDLFRTVSWWRRARISTCRAARDRKHDRMLARAERSSVSMGGKTNKKPSVSSIISDWTGILVGTAKHPAPSSAFESSNLRTGTVAWPGAFNPHSAIVGPRFSPIDF